jgi:hypothetical protein
MTSCYSLTDHKRLWPDLTLAQRQRLGVESSGAPLNDDGIEGPRTRSGIYIAPGHSHGLLKQAIWACLQGAKEDGTGPGSNNNRGTWPALFMGDKIELGWTEEDRRRFERVEQGPWCAGFVSWCIRTAYGEAGQPQALGAKYLTRLWARRPGQEVTLHTAQAGDLIAWRREARDGNKAAGHIGIIWGRHDGKLLVMEGNGGRQLGAVGLYGYDLRTGAKRGSRAPQDVVLLARRPDLTLEG